MTIWFTADEHFGHENIIDYCKRPYDSVRRMAQSITGRLNKLVHSEDIVYHLGDFTLEDSVARMSVKRLFQRMSGIHELILGNHDYWYPHQYLEIGFRAVHTSLELNIAGRQFILAHDPAIANVLSEDVIFLHGHIHTLYKHLLPKKVINVGVDVWDFNPVSSVQILDLVREYDSRL